MKKNLANIITFSRLLGTIALYFTEALSPTFFFIYVWCGLSDILDGFIARKTNTISSFGSKLDSISDLCFNTTMMICIYRHLKKYYPLYVWILIFLAVGIRIGCYVAVGIRKGIFQSRHTIYNKVNSFMMFLLPFIVQTKFLIPYSLLVLVVAFSSDIEEIGYISRTWNEGPLKQA